MQLIGYKKSNTLMLMAGLGVAALWFALLSAYFATPPVAPYLIINPRTTAYMQNDPHETIQHKWRPLSAISKNLQNAVILAEDDQFFNHPGYDLKAMKRAWKINQKRGRFAKGASTITMQVARNLYLSPRKSLLRKAREVWIALKLELYFPKERILEIYLNVAEWGNGIYGAEAAARHYFGKSARSISKEEAAWLASILPRPRFYDRNRNAAFPHIRAQGIAERL
jgi:monofunctional biosynthetic peptidoglycan transglycosylase